MQGNYKERSVDNNDTTSVLCRFVPCVSPFGERLLLLQLQQQQQLVEVNVVATTSETGLLDSKASTRRIKMITMRKVLLPTNGFFHETQSWCDNPRVEDSTVIFTLVMELHSRALDNEREKIVVH